MGYKQVYVCDECKLEVPDFNTAQKGPTDWWKVSQLVSTEPHLVFCCLPCLVRYTEKKYIREKGA